MQLLKETPPDGDKFAKAVEVMTSNTGMKIIFNCNLYTITFRWQMTADSFIVVQADGAMQNFTFLGLIFY